MGGGRLSKHRPKYMSHATTTTAQAPQSQAGWDGRAAERTHGQRSTGTGTSPTLIGEFRATDSIGPPPLRQGDDDLECVFIGPQECPNPLRSNDVHTPLSFSQRAEKRLGTFRASVLVKKVPSHHNHPPPPHDDHRHAWIEIPCHAPPRHHAYHTFLRADSTFKPFVCLKPGVHPYSQPPILQHTNTHAQAS